MLAPGGRTRQQPARSPLSPDRGSHAARAGDDARGVMSAALREEAATEEVVALAGMLTPLPHTFARADDDEDDELPLVADERGRDADAASRPLPLQRDEFTCGRCFLVVHVSRRARPGEDCCTDCAS